MVSLGWPGCHRLVRVWANGLVEGALDLGSEDPVRPGCALSLQCGSRQDTYLRVHLLS